jgi:hypothetical protein
MRDSLRRERLEDVLHYLTHFLFVRIALDRRTALRGIREIQEVELKLSRGREYEVVQQMLAIPLRNLKSRSSIFGSFTLGENYAPLVSILRYNCRVCNSGEDHRTARSASNARGRELWQPPRARDRSGGIQLRGASMLVEQSAKSRDAHEPVGTGRVAAAVIRDQTGVRVSD